MASDKEGEIRVYMVDRDMPGITLEQLAQTEQAAVETSRQFTAGGRPVRYIRSTYVPGESRVLSLFEGPSAGLVREVNDAAGLPYTRVVEAMDLSEPCHSE